MTYWHIGNSKKARAMVAITVVKTKVNRIIYMANEAAKQSCIRAHHEHM
jgi:hypothetical protein